MIKHKFSFTYRNVFYPGTFAIHGDGEPKLIEVVDIPPELDHFEPFFLEPPSIETFRRNPELYDAIMAGVTKKLIELDIVI